MFAALYTVEFQKHGFPHFHILLWLASKDKFSPVDDIDSIKSMELPDKTIDPIGHKTVTKFMMNAPHKLANPK